jgi:hypothetical protein
MSDINFNIPLHKAGVTISVYIFIVVAILTYIILALTKTAWPETNLNLSTVILISLIVGAVVALLLYYNLSK